MNDLARMIDKLARAEQAGDPQMSLKILTGFQCSACGADLEPEQYVLPFTLGLPIRCEQCSTLSEEAKA